MLTAVTPDNGGVATIIYLIQGVSRKEQNEKREETSEDEKILLRTRHLIRAETVVGVILEPCYCFRLREEGVLQKREKYSNGKLRQED